MAYQPRVIVCGIYGIFNTVTGKCYIGSSVQIIQRYKHGHLSRLRRNCHHSIKLQRSFNKHGENAFRLCILVVCGRDELEAEENRLITLWDAFHNGYNGRPDAEACRGGTVSPETRKKISDKLKGRTIPKDVCVRMGESRRGIKHTDEARRNMSEARKGWVPSDETRAKWSEQRSGRVITEETRKRMCEASPHRKLPPDHAEKLAIAGRKAATGRQQSDEEKLKRANSIRATIAAKRLDPSYVHPNKNRTKSEETKQKLRDAAERRRTTKS